MDRVDATGCVALLAVIARTEVTARFPSGKAIAGQYGRQERWGRLVKQAGLEGAFATDEQAA